LRRLAALVQAIATVAADTRGFVVEVAAITASDHCCALSPAWALEDVFQSACASGSGLADTVYYYDGSFGTWPAARQVSVHECSMENHLDVVARQSRFNLLISLFRIV
jgi:hypothetical protein